ncbi:ATP-dependent zinc protease [Vibrio sp. Of7-15]|uniref:ATP-dependent zinc protease family protein n=1 Tax=Vibrio sp. Of7-15 TaxID=2724879 RepID=UPI001EF37353|nr:ATP-dependent zinc protease [Vibrio sp. Of7-15]MCG7495294.1 ATP-dependent zinc protease [Vibrio sp. Of7-15]
MKKYAFLSLPLLLAGCINMPSTTNDKEETTNPSSSAVEKPVSTEFKTADGKLILGEKEWVYVDAISMSVEARVDTGATTSSISAVDIVPFERDGQDWVKFKLAHNDRETKEMQAPVSRWVRITQSSTEGYDRRPVIEAWIQIGELKQQTEFTLTDRSHLKFGVLLGRSFFRDVAIVDVSKRFVQPKK